MSNIQSKLHAWVSTPVLISQQGVLLPVRGWQSLKCCEICRGMLCQARCASYKDEQGIQEHHAGPLPLIEHKYVR